MKKYLKLSLIFYYTLLPFLYTPKIFQIENVK